MVDGPYKCQTETASVLAMGALGCGGRNVISRNGSGGSAERGGGGVAVGPVHWQLHMGCGKKMGSLTFIHAQSLLRVAEVIRRVGKSSRTDD